MSLTPSTAERIEIAGVMIASPAKRAAPAIASRSTGIDRRPMARRARV
jgi:hypothetical protein